MDLEDDELLLEEEEELDEDDDDEELLELEELIQTRRILLQVKRLETQVSACYGLEGKSTRANAK